ncbi:MAG: response regulator transcription factor [Ruminococcaceae bacterium]|nr:response regulator transcription factor [Oscillospiraceae bacterium]
MKIAICDDNRDCISQLEKNLKLMNNSELSYDVFAAGEDLICSFEKNPSFYDAVFLDMEMSGVNGITTANEIRKMNKLVVIIFVTNHIEYAIQSFECEPFRYMLKPVNENEFKKVYDALVIKLSQERTSFVFSSEREIIRLYSDEVLYFEKHSHWIYVYTEKEMYKTKKTMTDLLNSIDNLTFASPHKSYVVNLDCIKRVNDKGVYIYGSDNVIPISRSFKKEFMNRFIHYKERKVIL